MAKFKYKAGDRFNRWTLLNYNGNRQWLAKCDCGLEQLCYIEHLTSGKSTQCKACRDLEQRTSAYSNKAEYRSWNHMKQRCFNTNNDRYDQYGGRGITICSEWEDFEVFLKDIGKRPEGTSLDRINVDGPYNKDNCRWATAQQQQRNLQIHKTNGIGKAITELAEEFNLPTGTLGTRLSRGWSLERATTEPVHEKSKSISALARMAGLTENTVQNRIYRGWSLERALNTPIKRRITNRNVTKLCG